MKGKDIAESQLQEEARLQFLKRMAAKLEWAPQRPTGQEIFDEMSKEEQDEVFGEETANLLRAGKIELADVVKRTGSPATTEDAFLTVKPAKELE